MKADMVRRFVAAPDAETRVGYHICLRILLPTNLITRRRRATRTCMKTGLDARLRLREPPQLSRPFRLRLVLTRRALTPLRRCNHREQTQGLLKRKPKDPPQALLRELPQGLLRASLRETLKQAMGAPKELRKEARTSRLASRAASRGVCRALTLSWTRSWAPGSATILATYPTPSSASSLTFSSTTSSTPRLAIAWAVTRTDRGAFTRPVRTPIGRHRTA